MTYLTNFVAWIIGLVFEIPFFILKTVGGLMPECSTLGMYPMESEWYVNAFQWIRFMSPWFDFIDFDGWITLLSAILMYIGFLFLWRWLPSMISLGKTFWIIVVVFFVISAFLTIINSGWESSDAFMEVFGSSATSGWSGGGFGGGGGGSW